jgi:hypothetical protein
MTTAETISGRVEARNERGIRVAGEWRNVSKFKPLELPDVGAAVAVGLDPKGFITTLEVLDDDVTVDGRFVRRRINSQQDDDETLVRRRTNSQRDQTITRLAVLKAAAAFGAARPDLKSGDVLRIADSWLEWVES